MKTLPHPKPLRTLLIALLASGLAGCLDDDLNVYNTPPGITIELPAEDGLVFADGTVEFQATVHDDQDAATALVVTWESSLVEEPLEVGSPDSTGHYSLIASGLLPGEHVVTATVVDTQEASDKTSVTIIVPTDPPLVNIVEPLSGFSYYIDEPVQFRGETFSPEGEPESMAVLWTSDAIGEIYAANSDTDGITVTSDLLPEGPHLITLTATDASGAIGFASKAITVLPYPPGQLDQDGDGFCPDGIDADGNGHCDDSEVTGPNTQDCNDAMSQICPSCPEVCDGVPDNNCDGLDDQSDLDIDNDHWSECQGDCDNNDPLRSPDLLEQCDGIDNDCDEEIDEHDSDVDGDGYGALCDGDCVDTNPNINPGVEEECNGLDDNCDGYVPLDEYDLDGDSYRECSGDCDDNNPIVNPGMTDLCDELDNNCNGIINDNYVGPYEEWETSPTDGGYDIGGLGPTLNFGSGTCAVSGILVLEPGQGSINGVFSDPTDLYDNYVMDTGLTSNVAAWLAFLSSGGTGLPSSCQAGSVSFTSNRPISVTVDIDGDVHAASGTSGNIPFSLAITQLFNIDYRITVQPMVAWTDCNHTYTLNFVIP